MANKNILVSNNGKYEPISASVDDVTSVLSSSVSVTASTSSFVAQSGLMQIYNGKLMPVANSSVSSPQDNYSGSLLTYDSAEGFGPSRTVNAAFSGDISGDIATGIKVRSVSNVTGGLLPLVYGGTGTGSFVANSLVTTSGSGLIPNANNKIVVGNNNGSLYQLMDKPEDFIAVTKATVYLYTGVVGSNTAYTWTKPSNCRFVRVICQGGGGGGAGGTSGGSGFRYDKPGQGGNGGGYSDAIYYANSITNIVTVTVGGGGNRGLRNVNPLLTYASAGGDSSFGGYIFAYGGAGGRSYYYHLAPFTPGYTEYGARAYGAGIANGSVPGSGGSDGTPIGTANARLSAPAGGMGWYGYYAAPPDYALVNGGIRTSINLAGGLAGSASSVNGSDSNVGHYFKFGTCILNGVLSNWPAITSSGAGGSYKVQSSTVFGGNGLYGAGGGGGGSTTVGSTGGANGGNGGAGYVLIICY